MVGSMATLYEHAGGDAGLHRLEEVFYSKVLADPLLQPVFGKGQPHHVEHLTWFTAESFGGPDASRASWASTTSSMCTAASGSPTSSANDSSRSTWRLSTRPVCPTTRRSAKRFALTSSSVHVSPSGTHERPPTTSSTPSTTFRSGSGKETTKRRVELTSPQASSRG
jgi:Bacterial-like globin